MNNNNSNYEASNIEIIEGLDAVRKRPGMYIGDTRSRGLHHLLREIIDNSLDEHLAGFADEITVTLNEDNSVEVEDNGRGIPPGIHPKTKKSTIETVFTILHAGGKFGGKNSSYKISGGLHGVGASVVNALSKSLTVVVWRGEYRYEQVFSNGAKSIGPLLKQRNRERKKHGTKVSFAADPTIFSSIHFNNNLIKEWIEQIAFLNPNLKINLIDFKNETKLSFHYPDGLKMYIDHLTKRKKEFIPGFYFEVANQEIILRVAFKYTLDYEEEIFSFVNNINTEDGGSHETAFKSAFTKVFNNYLNDNNLKTSNLVLEGSDFREGLSVVISVYVIEKYLQFEGQTKTKLSSPDVKKFVEQKSYDELNFWIYQNQEQVKMIIDRAKELRRIKEANKKMRELGKNLSKNNNKKMLGKLVPAQSKKASECELFLVEGDSAGGSAKLGRDSKFQAILPLKGKIINTEKSNLKTILANDELNAIIYAIGGGLGKNFQINKVNYDKIIIMTDADTDGAHIQVLLLTFFYRFMFPLLENGKIFLASPPLYKIKRTKNKSEIYAWDNDDLQELKKQFVDYEIQRYKGLGEMNFQQLWDTTMNPETRTLIKVEVDDLNLIEKRVDTLMGKNIDNRRKWIENNVEFSDDDEFDEV